MHVNYAFGDHVANHVGLGRIPRWEASNLCMRRVRIEATLRIKWIMHNSQSFQLLCQPLSHIANVQLSEPTSLPDCKPVQRKRCAHPVATSA